MSLQEFDTELKLKQTEVELGVFDMFSEGAVNVYKNIYVYIYFILKVELKKRTSQNGWVAKIYPMETNENCPDHVQDTSSHHPVFVCFGRDPQLFKTSPCFQRCGLPV